MCRYGWGALCSKFGRGQRLNLVGFWRPLLSGATSQIRACWLRREGGLPRTAENISDLRTNTRPGLRGIVLTPQKNRHFCQKGNFAFIGWRTFHFASDGVGFKGEHSIAGYSPQWHRITVDDHWAVHYNLELYMFWTEIWGSHTGIYGD